MFGAFRIALQPDGKIVIAGYTDWGESWPADFMIARFHPDGSRDTGFGGVNSNVRYLNFASGADVALAPDGQLDPTFGENGKVMNLSGNNANANALLVQPDGKAILGGYYNQDFLLVRCWRTASSIQASASTAAVTSSPTWAATIASPLKAIRPKKKQFLIL